MIGAITLLKGALCKSRLASLLKRVSLKPGIVKHYDDAIRQQLEQGIMEPADQGVNRGVRKVHNHPHYEVHEVIRIDNQTTKLRIVCDASSRAEKQKHSKPK